MVEVKAKVNKITKAELNPHDTVVNLDKVLEKKVIISIANLEPTPVSAKVPRGYPLLIELPGKTWYEKALNYKEAYGHEVIPVKYRQINETAVIERTGEDLKQINKQLEPFWAEGEK